MPNSFILQSTLHAGVIMDGNGRWALARGLPREAGHRAGVETVTRIVQAAPDAGIGILTLFAFSSDNLPSALPPRVSGSGCASPSTTRGAKPFWPLQSTWPVFHANLWSKPWGRRSIC